MNKTMTILIFASLLLLLTACGGGNGSLNDSCDCGSLSLSAGDTRDLYPGDQLIPSGGNAIYNVVDVFGKEYKKVTILEGGVDILYGAYDLDDYPR